MPNYYANPNPLFQPAMRLIAAITNASPAVVTTTFAHQYISGNIVRLDIPPACGMQQANQQFGPISVISPTTFSIAIDTTLYYAFVIPTFNPLVNTAAQCIPMAEINSILTAAVQNQLG
jgi:hypothetical protein